MQCIGDSLLICQVALIALKWMKYTFCADCPGDNDLHHHSLEMLWGIDDTVARITILTKV